jgi:hypothetical protein
MLKFSGATLLWWLLCRKRIPKPICRGFDSLFFLVGWLIWKLQNARTFNGVATPPAQMDWKIQEEVDNWCLAGFRKLRVLIAFS